MESLIVTVKSAVEDLPMPDIVKPYVVMSVPLLLKILYGLLILWVGKKIADGSERLSKSVLERAKVDVSLSGFLSSLVKYTVLAAAVIATLDQIGIKTTGLVAIFASAGLAVGLALQGSLSNFAAGTMILGFRPFKVGDVVKAGGATGKVEMIGIFTTTLLTLDNEQIIVPNSAITGGNIENYTAKNFRRVHTDIGVAYGEDLEKAEEVLVKAAAKTAKRLEDMEPDAFISGFGASSVDFNVRVFCRHEHYWAVKHDLRKQVYAGLNEAGIEIPFNQIVVHQA
ncbi:MAG: mechanosensitive ion channel family protein [Candidatus Eremiobacteraeota bacterium]|nr:mechanosensitive ion channel family protein [Candidatus Eremiobacteraeota bacterium]